MRNLTNPKKREFNNIDKQAFINDSLRNNSTSKKRKLFTITLPECIIYTIIGIGLFVLLNFLLASQDKSSGFIISFFLLALLAIIFTIFISTFVVLIWFIYFITLSKK